MPGGRWTRTELPVSKDEALAMPGATPSGYGLSKWGLDQVADDPA